MDVLQCLNIDGCGRISHRKKVLSLIQATGKICRADLARTCQISVQAVSNIVEDLLEAGLIRSAGQGAPRRGGPVALYELNPGGGYVLGFEVRPDVLFATLLDLAGNRHQLRRLALPDRCQNIVLDQICTQAAELANKIPAGHKVIGAGVAMPGPFGATGLASSCTSFHGWDRGEVAQILSKRLGIKVLVDNDAAAGICAEHLSGPARGVNDLAYLYFGMGLGLGLMSSRKPLTGAFGNFGEIGSLSLGCSGGVVEDTLSRAALMRHLRQHGIAAHTIDELAELHLRKHPAVISWLHLCAPVFNRVISLVENLFDPETIVIGGAMPKGILATLIDMTILPDRTVSVRPDRELPRLQLGTCGAHAACVGSATMMLNHVFSTPKVM